jgi:hypothetical protein
LLLGGLSFGGMHVVLEAMGLATAPLILLTVFVGLAARRCHEKTGSLLSAIIIHALFNVGGMVLPWLLQSRWLRAEATRPPTQGAFFTTDWVPEAVLEPTQLKDRVIQPAGGPLRRAICRRGLRCQRRWLEGP